MLSDDLQWDVFSTILDFSSTLVSIRLWVSRSSSLWLKRRLEIALKIITVLLKGLLLTDDTAWRWFRGIEK